MEISKIPVFNHPKSEGKRASETPIHNPKSFQLKKMAQPADKADEARLEKACKDFEAIILNKIFAAMRKTVPEGGLFKKSFGEKIYQSMLDEEMSKNIAHSRGMGLGELLFQQLAQKNNNIR